MKSNELLNRVKSVVRDVSPDAEIILFGSRARESAVTHSDWDFLILLNKPIDKQLEQTIKDRLYDLELETDTVLSSIIRTKQEWLSPQYAVLPFKKEVERDGIPL
jgi:uncharacterized protein